MDVQFTIGTDVLIIVAVVELIWLYTLVRHVTAASMKATDKICWTVVLCVLNVLGLVLYWIFAPTTQANAAKVDDDDIKRACNEGRL